jgi:hypothetical protein
MPPCAFAPGFRLSVGDILILVAGTVGAVVAARIDQWAGVAVGFVVGHFFLFCNILRMSRRLELVWAAAFSILAISSVVWGLWRWPVVLVCTSGLTVSLAAVEMRRPSYRGAGWRRLNPDLPRWWAAQGERHQQDGR